MGVLNSKQRRSLGRLPLELIPRIFQYMEVLEVAPCMIISRKFLKCVNLSYKGRKVGDSEVMKLVMRNAPEGLLLSLIREGCFSDCSNLSMKMIFLNCVKFNFSRLLKELLNHIEPNDRMFNLAVRHGRVSLVKIFLSDGRIDPVNGNNTPAQLACDIGNLKILKKLCRSSKKVDFSANRNYCIRKACEKGYRRVVQFLLRRPEVDPTAFYSSCFSYAAEGGHYEVCRLLLEDGRVDPSAESNYALRGCSLNNHVEILKLLMSLDCVNPAEFGNYSLRFSAKRGHYDIVRQLMRSRDVRRSVTDVKKAYLEAKCEKTRKYLKKHVERNRRRKFKNLGRSIILVHNTYSL